MLAFPALLMAACMPTDRENVNTELFKNKEEFREKAEQLKPGMSRKKVFELLGVTEDKFQRLSLSEIQTSIYGNSQVQGTPEQLEKFKRRLQAYEGYALPYKKIKSDSSLGFGIMKMHKSGQDLKLILVFENKKLSRASVEGTENLNLQNDQYIWSNLISKGLGLAF